MKPSKYPLLLIFILLLAGYSASAQAPQWQWATGAGGPGPDVVSIIVVDSMGNVYEYGGVGSAYVTIGGHTSPGDADGSSYLAKYSPDGSIIWINFYNASTTLDYSLPSPVTFSNMVLDANGNICTFGSFASNSFAIGSDTIYAQTSFYGGNFMAKFNPVSGAFISLTHIATGTNPYAAITLTKVIPRPNGHFAVLGTYSGDMADHRDTIGALYFPYQHCHFIADLDSNGAFTGGKILSVDTSDWYAFHMYTDDIVLSSAGNIYLSGGYDSATAATVTPAWHLPFLSSDSSSFVFLAKFDSAFNFTWSRTNSYRFGSYYLASHSGNAWNNATSLAPGLNDNVYMAGTFSGDSLFFDTFSLACYRPPIHYSNTCFLARFDSTGTAKWLGGYQAPTGDVIPSNIASDPLGNVYVYLGGAGGITYDTTYIGANYEQATISKVSPDGKAIWANSSSNSSGSVSSSILGSTNMVVDGIGDVYVSGQFQFANAYFGSDTLIFHTPTASDPYNGDLFTAKLGNCHPATPVITASSALHWCGIDSVLLSTPSAHNYLWSNGDTTSSVTAHTTGQYSVYAIDTLGCYARSAIDSVHAYPQPVLSVTAAAEVHCYGGNDGKIMLLPTGGTSPYSYTAIPFVASYNMVSAGIYTITSTDHNGCTATDTVTITQPSSALTMHMDSVANTVASGNGIAIVTASGGAAPYSYVWNTVPPQYTDSATNLVSGWYDVTVIDSNGCQKIDSVFVLSNTATGINSLLLNTIGLQIFPNPSNDGNVTVMLTNTIGNGLLTLYNSYGQLVSTQAIQGGRNECHFNLPAGYYTTKIVINGFQQSEKLSIIK